MTSRPWDDVLSERDRAVIEKSGYADRGAVSWDSRAFGDAPALLVTDMQRYIVGEDAPILEVVEENPVAMGEVAWDAIGNIEPLLEFARERDVPVIYTKIVPPTFEDASEAELAIVDPLSPREGEPVVRKSFASGFFGTDLAPRLIRRGIDTLVVVGNTTSGCLRATVVDAQQFGFSVVVPQDCTFDRLEASHKVGLLDMWMKYATVTDSDEVRERLAGR